MLEARSERTENLYGYTWQLECHHTGSPVTSWVWKLEEGLQHFHIARNLSHFLVSILSSLKQFILP